jgi:hypothetical protein
MARCSIWCDDDALDLGARELAALVLATARTAAERAAAGLKRAVEPLEPPLDVAAPGEHLGAEPAGQEPGPPGTAFDQAIERAEQVADRVEERVRGMDAGPR